MKRNLMLALSLLTTIIIFSACHVPMMQHEGMGNGEMNHGEMNHEEMSHEEMGQGAMAHGEMATDEMIMAELPDTVDGELTVVNVQANLSMPTTTGSVWMAIQNGTATDDALIGAEIPGCGVIELHEMLMQNDLMVMQEVEGGEIPIPAGETVILKRGGLHIMCIEKEAPLEVGSTVDMVLHFAQAADIAVTAPVVDPGTMNMNQGAKGNMGAGAPDTSTVSESEPITDTGE